MFFCAFTQRMEWIHIRKMFEFAFFPPLNLTGKLIGKLIFKCHPLSVSHSVVSDSLWPHIISQVPLSVEFSRQEYWSGLTFPSPENLPDLGIASRYPALQEDSWPSEPSGKPLVLKKNRNKKITYDTAIPLLGIYPENNIIQKDTCTPVFIAALLTIAKTWKHPRCPSMGEWIKKLRYMYTVEYYLAIKRNKCGSVDWGGWIYGLLYRVK